MKWIAAVLFLLLVPANAQTFAAGAANGNSPLLLNDSTSLQFGGPQPVPCTDTTGKTSATPTVGTGTLVLIVNSQSVADNTLPTAVTPTNTTKVLQLDVYNQTVYQAAGNLLGTDGTGGTGCTTTGNYQVYLADKLVTDGKFSQVILVPVGIGGSSVQDWSPVGMLNQRARVSCLAVRAKGWIGSGASFGILYDQGNADANNNTLHGVPTAATWESLFGQWQSTFAGLGCNFPIFVATETMQANVTNATIQGAQAAVVDNVSVFAGANTDSLTGTTNRWDGTHLTNVGGQSNANLWATIIEAHY